MAIVINNESVYDVYATALFSPNRITTLSQLGTQKYTWVKHNKYTHQKHASFVLGK